MESTKPHGYKPCNTIPCFWKEDFELVSDLNKINSDHSKITRQKNSIKNLYDDVRQYENYWLDQLKKLKSEIDLPINHANDKANPNLHYCVEVAVKKFSANSANRSTILTSALIYFYRFNNYLPYTIAFSNNFLNNLSPDLKSIFSEYVPLTIDLKPNCNFTAAFSYINKQVLETENNKTFINNLIKRGSDSYQEKSFPTNFSINIVKSIKNYKPILPATIAMVITEASEIYIYGNKAHLAKNPLLKAIFENCASHIGNILETVSKNENQPIYQLPLLTPKEHKKITVDWNDTKKDYPLHKTLSELFEEQAKKNPNNTAVFFEGQTLTYKELNAKANRVAHHLRSLGVKQNSLVALCVEKSLGMIVGMLGILKAGGAYVPLDPNYPENRLQFMLEDSQAQIILTQKALLAQSIFLDKNKKQILCLDADTDTTNKYSSKNPSIINSSENLVYMIYTSGSTGTPKGTLVKHSSVVNIAYFAAKELFKLKTTTRVSLFTSISFDVSVAEIWPTLLSGSAIYIIPEHTRKNPNEIHKFINKNSINVLSITPAVLKNLSCQKTEDLETIVVAGETCDINLANNWSKHTRFINAYGPTEATVFATSAVCSPKQKNVTIGKPCPNTKIHILDKYLQQVPIGTIGEIYIGGEAVSLGYFNRPELTKERFIPNPIDNGKTKLYKTGDLARWLPSGNIDFIDRADNQIKIRGFRVELDEINEQLQKYPNIKQSIVLAKKNDLGNTNIIAYVTCNDKLTFDVDDCKKCLSDFLPDYMIPAAFVTLDSLPLNQNGKIDKKALLDLKNDNHIRSAAYVPTTTDNEKIITKIWSEVLGLESQQIGIQDNFFDLGGNSLISFQAILKINSHFKINLGPEVLFNYSTIKLLAKKINSSKFEDQTTLTKASPKKYYPLSYEQELIWMHQQAAPKTPFYNEPIIINIKDNLNVPALEKSLNEIIKRHEILRTNVIAMDGLTKQFIRPFKPLDIPYFDLRELPENKRKNLALKIGTKQLKKIFNLEQDSLIRFSMVRLQDKNYQLFIAAHHIIFDGISIFDIFTKELEALYQEFATDKPTTLPTLKLQYKDYCVWQKEQNLDTSLNKSLGYWKNKLDNLQPLQLPTKQCAAKNHSFRGKRQCLSISKEATEQLEKISRQENVTLFITLFTALNILLYRYSNQEDIAIGTAVAGRNNISIEKMFGNFLNTLILRNKISGPLTIQQLLQEIRSTTIEAYAHQDLPFQELLKNIKIPRNNSNHLPFQVAFIFEPNIETPNHAWGISQLETHPGTSKFEMMFELDKRPEGIIGRVEYNTDLFDDWFIKQMIVHFQTLLQNLTENLHTPINEAPLMPPKDNNKILKTWNKTEAQYPTETIHELFEKQVKKTPDNLAITFENQTLTYDELNKKANQLASYLKKLGAKPETLIAICIHFDKCIETIVAILAVLKANAAYIPIDPRYPKARIEDILKDSNTPILITDQTVYSSLQMNNIKAGVIDTVFIDKDQKQIEKESANNIPKLATQDNLAYVIYTSGSTGKPKGVLLPHRTITNLIDWQTNNNINNLNQVLNVAQFASFGFDVSLQEIFYALLNGHKLHIISVNIKKSISNLIEFIQNKKINKLFLPPSILGLLAHEATTYNSQLSNLNEIIVASEALIINKNIRDFFANNKYIRLTNHYGPSETHVVTAYTLHPDSNQWAPLPSIGKPIANTQTYILDKNLQPVPVGVSGELYLAGTSMARGYLNRPDLNKDKFVQNPFSKDKNEKMYKTGDLCRWMPDGNITFMDRIDNQVKIRGFRVEIDEIEHCILQHDSVRQCAVKANSDQYGTKKLIGYIAYKDKKQADLDSIKQLLKAQLPDYMMPSAFITLDQLPLNNNGKVDTSALPKPIFDTSDSPKTKPKTDREKLLTNIWGEILKLNPKSISVDDSFFELGGHSLASLKLLTEIKKTFDVNLEPHELFNNSTIVDLLNIINEKQHSSEKQHQNSPHMILLKKGNTNAQPIFLIHPIGGTVFWYKNLVKYLNCKNHIYGIQDPSINSKDMMFNSLEEMASFYITEIKQVQPKGPYFLGGASFGGTVAIEMSKQLECQGDKIKHVVLFDSWAIYPDDVKKKQLFEKEFRKMHATLVAKSAAKRLSNIKPWLDLQWHRAQLLWSYPIKSISQKITLFKARDPMDAFRFRDHDSNYWQDHVTSKVETFVIPGDHETIFHEPNVKILANQLDQVLNPDIS